MASPCSDSCQALGPRVTSDALKWDAAKLSLGQKRVGGGTVAAWK